MKRFLLVLACLAVAAAGCDRRPIDAVLALPRPGELLPPFAFRLLGRTDSVSPSALRGHPAVVAIWRTTCQASRESVRSLEDIAHRYRSAGVSVVILSADDKAGRLQAFVDSAGLDIPVALMGSHEARRLFDRSRLAPRRQQYWILMALPSFLVVDTGGRIAMRAAGYTPQLKGVRVALDSLLRSTR